MKNPINFFFSLGDKVTKGDQVRKAQFDYYLMWCIFLAFTTVMVNYWISFYQTGKISSLAWGFVIFGILWFQYFALKMSRTAYLTVKSFRESVKNNSSGKIEEKIESEAEMLKGFEK